MNTDKPVNNEQINAYVDNQLSNEVQAEILNKSQSDEALADSICQTRVIKEMVKLSYQNPPSEQSGQQKKNINFLGYGIAASFILMFGGGVVGWIASNMYNSVNQMQHYAQHVELNTFDTINNHRVLLHIATDDSQRVDAALNNAEKLLTKHTGNEKFQLQILINADAINILQADSSPYVERIKTLASANEKLSFLACQRSIERQYLKGIDVHLVKEAKVIPEALEEIVSRLHQGWVYIRA